MGQKINGLKMLIIDDQGDARRLIRNMLVDMNITQISEASDGREAMSLLDLAPEMVDMVICDWNMPKMSGIELLKQLRTVDPDIPFLMLTGRGDMESVYQAKEYGVSAYVRKPFSSTQLEAKIRILNHKMKFEPLKKTY